MPTLLFFDVDGHELWRREMHARERYIFYEAVSEGEPALEGDYAYTLASVAWDPKREECRCAVKARQPRAVMTSDVDC